MTEKKSQVQKFRDLAREAECDRDEKTFDEKLKRIANRGSDSEEESEECNRNK